MWLKFLAVGFGIWLFIQMLNEALKPLLKELLASRELLQKCLEELEARNEHEGIHGRRDTRYWGLTTSANADPGPKPVTKVPFAKRIPILSSRKWASIFMFFIGSVCALMFAISFAIGNPEGRIPGGAIACASLGFATFLWIKERKLPPTT